MLYVCLGALNSTAQVKAEGIIWSSNKLTWDNFQEDRSNVKRPGVLASTLTKLYVTDIDTAMYQQKKGITVNVFALMIPSFSWVKESSLNSKSILAHEQLHFDIVELIARRMRKELSEQKVTIKNYNKAINTIKKQRIKMLAKMQREYDETHRQQWNKWVKDVTNEITELDKYKNTTVFMQLEDQ